MISQPIPVRIMLRKPSVLIANRKIGTFRTKFESQRGISNELKRPVRYLMMIARPETPPVTSPDGSKIYCVANAVIVLPRKITKRSVIRSFKFF